MKHSAFFYVLFALSLAFLFACSDGDSGNFLVRDDDTSYSNEEDDFSSSSARSSSSEVRSSSSSALSSSSSEQRGSSSSVNSSSLISSSSSVSSLSSSEDDFYLQEASRNAPSENCNFGSVKDVRDGQVYRTIAIGEQTWMAENLNFADVSPDYRHDSASVCYNNSPEYCEVFGRLYTLGASTKVCPKGWHLPSLEEWEVLFDYVGGIKIANRKLISSYGWKYQMGVEDRYCFTVLPAGRLDSHDYEDLGKGGFFWTSTSDEDLGNPVRNVYFDYQRDFAYEGRTDSKSVISVRCLKD